MPCEAAEQFRVCATFRRIPGKDNQIDRRQLSATDPEAFAHDALQAVSVCRVTNFLAGYRETEPRHVQGIRTIKYREEPV